MLVTLHGCAVFDRPSSYYKAVALNAFYDPYTIAPLVGAVVFGIGDLDQQTSDWAQRETPVFDSPSSALKASDRLRYGVDTAASILILTAPAKEEQHWLYQKSVGFLNAASSHSLTLNTTGVLKRETLRDRPNGSGSRDSFPSAHSSTAWNYAAVGRRFNHEAHYAEGVKTILDTGLNLTAASVAWARVEGGVHYPSDVLFGAALGNFFGLFIYDAFLVNADQKMRISFNPVNKEQIFFMSTPF